MGENEDYARTLAQSGTPLPPILVHRATRRIIDGTHRCRAASLRGQTEIEVRYFDGDERDAFVLAVETNLKNGLPLSLADRRNAALRIIRSHSQWSDRMIASVTGLAARTIATLRLSSGAEIAHLNTRMGLDGRSYPVNGVAARKRAAEYLADNPDASLREVAKAAGLSPATAKKVRDRMRSSQMPDAAGTSPRATSNHGASIDPLLALGSLRTDPAVRFNESGRALLRLLNFHLAGNEWDRIAAGIPPHCVTMVAGLARSSAQAWLRFAETLDERSTPEELTAAGPDSNPIT